MIIKPNITNICFIKVEISVISDHPVVIVRELWHVCSGVFNECETLVIREIIALTLIPLANWFEDQGEGMWWVGFDRPGLIDFV